MWEIPHNSAGWDCFKIPSSREISKTRSLLREEFCVFSAVTHLIPLVGCVKNRRQFRTVRRKQKSSLLTQVCAWMEFQLLNFGILLLKYFILLVTRCRGESCCITNRQAKRPTHELQDKNLELSKVDYVSANVTSSQQAAMLYIFEDNEAVIRLIIKGRSPTMRHVSRTHRVALDWLFDRINLDPKIQIKYMDTKHQLADILTKGHFTRDEWNNLLPLCTISNHSSNSELQKMAKRVQDGTGEERAIAKSRPTMNLVSQTLARSSMAQRSDASNRPGTVSASSTNLSLIASAGTLAARSSNQNDAASSSHVWQADAKTTSAGSAAAWRANQDLDLSTSTRKCVVGDL